MQGTAIGMLLLHNLEVAAFTGVRKEFLHVLLKEN